MLGIDISNGNVQKNDVKFLVVNSIVDNQFTLNLIFVNLFRFDAKTSMKK